MAQPRLTVHGLPFTDEDCRSHRPRWAREGAPKAPKGRWTNSTVPSAPAPLRGLRMFSHITGGSEASAPATALRPVGAASRRRVPRSTVLGWPCQPAYGGFIGGSTPSTGRQEGHAVGRRARCGAVRKPLCFWSKKSEEAGRLFHDSAQGAILLRPAGKTVLGRAVTALITIGSRIGIIVLATEPNRCKLYSRNRELVKWMQHH